MKDEFNELYYKFIILMVVLIAISLIFNDPVRTIEQENIVYQDSTVTIVHLEDYTYKEAEIQYKNDWKNYKLWEYYKQ